MVKKDHHYYLLTPEKPNKQEQTGKGTEEMQQPPPKDPSQNPPGSTGGTSGPSCSGGVGTTCDVDSGQRSVADGDPQRCEVADNASGGCAVADNVSEVNALPPKTPPRVPQVPVPFLGLPSKVLQKSLESSQPPPSSVSSSSGSESESDGDLDEHSSDLDYTGESGSSSSSTSEGEGEEELPSSQQLAKTPKYLVYERQIRELLKHVRCKGCESVLSMPDSDEDIGTMIGSALSVKLSCLNGHEFKWLSQPVIGDGSAAVPAGNLMIPAAILFSGNNFGKISHFANMLNFKLISKSTFNQHQADYLFPSIHDAWRKEQEEVWHEIRVKGTLELCGDGRCDSPGHNAKFGTYTVMDMKTNKVVDMETVQVSEVTSSNALEKEGCRRVLNRIEQELPVNVLATDRHLGIQKMMRLEYDFVQHQYDVWHLAKSVAKKLRQKAKKKGCEQLMQWIPAIKTHLWWCAATCEGDAQNMLERWLSVTHHVTNSHDWGYGTFSCCAHTALDEDELDAIKWLEAGSPAHKALNEVLEDTRLKNDIKKLNLFCHTGQLENYHGFLLKYAPKRIQFSYEGMVARLELAALDNNANVGRQQATVTVSSASSEAVGTPRDQVVYSKESKKVTRRVLYEAKSYDFVNDLMVDVIDRKEQQRKGETTNFVLPALPRNIIPKNVVVPSKQEVREAHQSRFSKGKE